jgi:hypothetical protein
MHSKPMDRDQMHLLLSRDVGGSYEDQGTLLNLLVAIKKK